MFQTSYLDFFFILIRLDFLPLVSIALLYIKEKMLYVSLSCYITEQQIFLHHSYIPYNVLLHTLHSHLSFQSASFFITAAENCFSGIAYVFKDFFLPLVSVPFSYNALPSLYFCDRLIFDTHWRFPGEFDGSYVILCFRSGRNVKPTLLPACPDIIFLYWI